MPQPIDYIQHYTLRFLPLSSCCCSLTSLRLPGLEPLLSPNLSTLSWPSFLDPAWTLHSDNFISIALKSLALFTLVCFFKTPTRITASVLGQWCPNRKNWQLCRLAPHQNIWHPTQSFRAVLNTVPSSQIWPLFLTVLGFTFYFRDKSEALRRADLHLHFYFLVSKKWHFPAPKESLNLFLKPMPSCQFRDFTPSASLFLSLFSNSSSLQTLRNMLKSLALKTKQNTPLPCTSLWLPFSLLLCSRSQQPNFLCQHLSLFPSFYPLFNPLTTSSLKWLWKRSLWPPNHQIQRALFIPQFLLDLFAASHSVVTIVRGSRKIK